MRVYRCLLYHNVPIANWISFQGFYKWKEHNSDRRITTPMHADRRELIGYDVKVTGRE
jgi:hypothetical protein